MSKELERGFSQAMLELYQTTRADTSYNPSTFFRMLSDHGGFETARRLVHASNVSEGYIKLFELNRLDLTVEAVIVDNAQWHRLFSEKELEICRKRLKDFRYKN